MITGLIGALFIIAILALLTWVCWKYITIEPVKYLLAGIFGICTVYRLILLALYLVGGG